MYSVLSHLTIQPQHVDEFITLIREHARECLRDEAGTLGFDVIQDETTPEHFYVHETYVDEAAFQAHMQGIWDQIFDINLCPRLPHHHVPSGHTQLPLADRR